MTASAKVRCAQCGTPITSSGTPYILNGETVCIDCLDKVEVRLPASSSEPLAGVPVNFSYITAFLVYWTLTACGVVCIVVALFVLLPRFDWTPGANADLALRAQRERLAAEIGIAGVSGLLLIGLGQLLRCARDIAIHTRSMHHRL